MKKHIAITMVTLGLLTVPAINGHATLENITFDGGGWSAVGQVNINGDTADSGWLNVTYGATTINYGYLAIGPLNGVVQDNNGDNLPYGDNKIDLSNVNFLDQYGLLFLTAPVVNGHSAGSGIYLSADQNHGYVPNLNGYGHAWGWGVPNVDGTATISSAESSVPEPSTYIAGMLLLIPFGISSVRILAQKRLQRI